MHLSVLVDEIDNIIIEIVFSSETKRKTYSKGANKVVRIGRNHSNEIVLDNFAYSRIHCTFFYSINDAAWFVQDGFEKANSTNGTWLYLDWSWPIDYNFNFRISSHNLGINIIN